MLSILPRSRRRQDRGRRDGDGDGDTAPPVAADGRLGVARVPACERSVDLRALVLGEVREAIVEGDEPSGSFYADLELDGRRLAAGVSAFDVDELVGERASPFGLELARSHPDVGSVGGAQDVAGEVLSR